MRWHAKLLVVLACALLVACGERPTEPVEFGWPVSISGFVRDQDDRGIQGVEAILRRGDGTVYGTATTRVSEYIIDGRTVERGHFSFGGILGSYLGEPPLIPGQYTLTVTPPAGYVVPASQGNPINISVTGHTEASSVTLNLTLHKN